MKSFEFGRLVLAAFSIFLCFQSINATGRGIVTSRQRDLQTLFSYELKATAKYGFGGFPNATTPDVAPTVSEMETLVRRTEIFYRQNLASKYSATYQGIALTYQAHNWDPSKDMLTLDFDLSVIFRIVGEIPNEGAVLNFISNVDSATYIRHVASVVNPQVLFKWTTSVDIEARAKNDVTAPTKLPVTAIQPPDPTSLIEPTASSTVSENAEPVSAVEKADAAPTSTTSGFFKFPTPAPTPKKDQTVPTSGTPNHFDSQQDSRPTTAEVPGFLDGTPEITDSMGETSGVQSDGASGTIDLAAAQQALEGAKGGRQSWIYEELSGHLTAPNMFYWIMAVRVMYCLVGFVLQKWGSSYQDCNKKLHLVSYWLQFSLYFPLLAILTWSLVSIQIDDKDIVKQGLFLFAQAAMLLLGLYGMEISLRSMDKTLMAQRLIFFATILYALDFHDSGLQNPIDQVVFGAVEAVGACSELAAQWNLINYRSWSDASPHEKESMRPGVAITLRLCLVCSILAKAIFVLGSIVWYVHRFDALTGSNLVFLIPLVRVVQAPTLIRSFYVQSQLYNRVTNTAPPAVVHVRSSNLKEMEHYDAYTEEDATTNVEDV